MKKLLIALLATAAFGSTAFAADLPVKAPIMKAPPPVASWSGCWVSGGVGYGWWNQDHFTESNETTGILRGVSLSSTDGGRGWLGRVGVGCDYQASSNWVIGAFADFDWMDVKGTSSQDLSGTFSPFFEVTGNETQRSAWAVGPRLGYLVNPNLLTFVSGGYTQTRFNQVNYFQNSGFGPGGIGSATGDALPATTYSGYFIGGGTEYRVPWWQNLTWKTEYRWSDYSARNIFDQCGGGACGAAGTERFGENSHKYTQTITSSLVWRFDWGGPVVARY